jgi:hypothetical protein
MAIVRRDVRQVRDLLYLLLTETRQAQRDMGSHQSAIRLDTLAMQMKVILDRVEKILE